VTNGIYPTSEITKAIKIYLIEKLVSSKKKRRRINSKILTKIFLKKMVFLLPISLDGTCDIALLKPKPNIAIIPNKIPIETSIKLC
jgi:hypothetical protein